MSFNLRNRHQVKNMNGALLGFRARESVDNGLECFFRTKGSIGNGTKSEN